MGAAAEHMQRECAEERRLSCRCWSLEMPAPAQPSVSSPSMAPPQGRGLSFLSLLPVIGVDRAGVDTACSGEEHQPPQPALA